MAQVDRRAAGVGAFALRETGAVRHDVDIPGGDLLVGGLAAEAEAFGMAGGSGRVRGVGVGHRRRLGGGRFGSPIPRSWLRGCAIGERRERQASHGSSSR